MKRIIGAAVIAVAAFGGAGAFDDNTVRDDSGAIVEGGGLGAFAIQIGDCFNIPEDTDIVMSLEAVPCALPHDAEAFASFDLTGTAWRGDDAVGEEAWFGCYEPFGTYVGTPWDDSTLDYWTLQPTMESWDELDDREVTCALTTVDGSKLTGSMKGSGL
jgi:hypothetical protein